MEILKELDAKNENLLDSTSIYLRLFFIGPSKVLKAARGYLSTISIVSLSNF